MKPVVSQTEPPRRANAAPNDAGARAGLEEQVAEHRAFEHARDLAAACDRLHHVGDAKQRLDGVARELIHRQELRLAFEQELAREALLLYALRMIFVRRRTADDFRYEAFDDFRHAARFLRIVGQQPRIQRAAADAYAIGKDLAGHVEAAHRVAQEGLLGNGHERNLIKNIRGAYISSVACEVKENLRDGALRVARRPNYPGWHAADGSV